jgi:hypothetical protein
MHPFLRLTVKFKLAANKFITLDGKPPLKIVYLPPVTRPISALSFSNVHTSVPLVQPSPKYKRQIKTYAELDGLSWCHWKCVFVCIHELHFVWSVLTKAVIIKIYNIFYTKFWELPGLNYQWCKVTELILICLIYAWSYASAKHISPKYI